MKITFGTQQTKADVTVIFADDRGKLTSAGKDIDKKTGGAVSRAIKSEKFEGKLAALLPVAGTSQGLVLVVGTGKAKDLTALACEKIGSAVTGTLKNRKLSGVTVIFDVTGLPKKLSAADAVAALAEAAVLNMYRFDKHYTKGPKKEKPALKSMHIVLKDAASAKKLYAPRDKVISGVTFARDMVNEAPNVLYPDSYAKIIKKELAPLGVTVKVLDEKDMKKMGMGALLAVGMGSSRPPRLVLMEYKKGKKGDKPIAFVGKGVTFDTGGISLKPGAGMGDMKWDMGGSGTVVGLMKALAGRKAKANVIGVVPLAENMPSGTACRPGDVVKTMSGQTVEILNTDAEGRLILCDALHYTQVTYKPSHIVDLATLTGAMIVALGHEYAGVFSNDDGFADGLLGVGRDTGEELWRMPLHDQWDKAMDSPIADMQNISGGKTGAGSATAAHYLKRFIHDGVKWAHLDIAGTAWAYRQKVGVPKGASGFGVRLLDRYVADHWE